MIDVVLVVSQSGHGLAVSQVVMADGREVWGMGPGGPARWRRAYASLDAAVDENDRATTTAIRARARDAEAARAMLGKPPPRA